VCLDDSKIGRHSVDRQRIGRLRRSFARTWHRSSGRSARCSAGSAVRIGYIRCGRPSTPGSSSKYRLNGGLENKNDAGCGSRPASLPPCAAVGSHRWLTTVSGLPAIVLSAQRLRQLGEVRRDPPGLVLGEPLVDRAAMRAVGRPTNPTYQEPAPAAEFDANYRSALPRSKWYSGAHRHQWT
jgi:hypothetical protein